MEESDEIRQLLIDFLRRRDQEPVASLELWSRRPEVLCIGTDPREWWSGFETIEAFERAMAEARGVPGRVVPVRVAGFQEGSVGWAVASSVWEWKGRAYPIRTSAIFHLENARWKLVHTARSVEITNEDWLGAGFPTSIESIAGVVQRDRPSLKHVVPSGGTLTILFTDIEGSSYLTEQLGDEAWMGLLVKHNLVIRQEIARHSWYEVKSLGDGFMVAFGSAGDALRCAIGIQRAVADFDEALRVRIGLHAGDVVREGTDFYGGAVNVAARIAGEARGSEILASSIVRALADGTNEFEFERETDVALRGLAGLHRLSTVRWATEFA